MTAREQKLQAPGPLWLWTDPFDNENAALH